MKHSERDLFILCMEAMGLTVRSIVDTPKGEVVLAHGTKVGALGIGLVDEDEDVAVVVLDSTKVIVLRDELNRWLQERGAAA